MMENNNFLLKSNQSKKTILDKAYFKHIADNFKIISEEDEIRWEIYSLIIEELIKIGKGSYLKEIKYRISDGENPNNVILSIIEKEDENVNNIVWYFKKRIEEFIEEDLINRFLP